MDYKPHLDGLRALAALAVLAVHAGVPYTPGGFVGVDVFFVLSGYLITTTFSSNPDLKTFYINRALRLFPALFLMLLCYLLIFPRLIPNHNHFIEAFYAAIYITDYTKAFTDVHHYLSHTWSLSVEEHFYLLWPLILIRFNPSAKAIFIGVIAASIFRAMWVDGREAYFKLDTRMAGLLLGCFLAKVSITQKFPAWPGLLILGIIINTTSTSINQWPKEWGLVIAQLAASIAILGTPPKWLSNSILVYIGKISYGVYLWHFPIAEACKHFNLHWQETLALTSALSLSLAYLSYVSIESYAKKFRATARRKDEEHLEESPTRQQF